MYAIVDAPTPDISPEYYCHVRYCESVYPWTFLLLNIFEAPTPDIPPCPNIFVMYAFVEAPPQTFPFERSCHVRYCGCAYPRTFPLNVFFMYAIVEAPTPDVSPVHTCHVSYCGSAYPRTSPNMYVMYAIVEASTPRTLMRLPSDVSMNIFVVMFAIVEAPTPDISPEHIIYHVSYC